MHYKKSTSGYLIIAAAIFIVIISALVSAALYLYSNNAALISNRNHSMQAFYSAEAGSQYLSFLFLKQNANCDDLNLLAATTFADSALHFSATHYNPDPASTLTSSLNNSATTIPIGNTSGYAPYGRVTIDDEQIDYFGLQNSPPALLNALRGRDETTVTAHQNGALVLQNLCFTTSKAATPNFNNPLGERQVSLLFTQSSHDIWAVGSKGSIFNWNGESWTENSSKITNATLRGISTVKDGSEAFIVGDKNGNSFTILRWNGNTWQTSPNVPTANYAENLTSVAMDGKNRAWAVGAKHTVGKKAYRFTILYWNGNNWCALRSGGTCSGKTMPADGQNSVGLTSVSFLDPTKNNNQSLGFAVGLDGKILKYQNNSWTLDSSPTNNDLNAVKIVSNHDAWAAGNHSTLLHWNGSRWEAIHVQTNMNFLSIDAIDIANNGYTDEMWAFARGGHYIHYNGKTMHTGHVFGGNGNDVLLLHPNDTWIVGIGRNRATHYNGSEWTNYRVSSEILYGIDYMKSGKGRKVFSWSE